MSFILRHFTEIVGGLCLAWGLFSLGRLYEREHRPEWDEQVLSTWPDGSPRFTVRREGVGYGGNDDAILWTRPGPYDWRNES